MADAILNTALVIKPGTPAERLDAGQERGENSL